MGHSQDGTKKEMWKKPQPGGQVTLSNPTDSKMRGEEQVLASIVRICRFDRPPLLRLRSTVPSTVAADRHERTAILANAPFRKRMAPSAEEAASLVSASSEGYGSTVSF